jgi:hypothetical protein
VSGDILATGEAMKEMDQISKIQHQGNVVSLFRPHHHSVSSTTSAWSSDVPEEPPGGSPDGTEAARSDQRVYVQNDTWFFLYVCVVLYLLPPFEIDQSICWWPFLRMKRTFKEILLFLYS